MDIFSEANIKKTIFISSITLVVLLSLAFGVLYITEKYFQLEKDLTKIEEEFIRHEKQLLKTVVNHQIKLIEFRHAQIHTRIEAILQKRVTEAIAVAENLYQTNKQQYSHEEIAVLIREALRPVRFNEGRGYYFAFDLNGHVELYPPNRMFEHHNAAEVFSPHGQEIVANMSKLATEESRGFIEYLWPIPGQNPAAPAVKLAFVRYVDFLDWFIGTGEYFAPYSEMTREQVISDIRDSMGEDALNYFFVYQLHSLEGGKDFATMLINPNRPDLIGQRISDDFRDARGKEFRKEFLQGLRANGEAFVTYWYKKYGAAEPQKKLSYFKLYPEWNWVVAKGIYLDELDNLINKEKADLQSQVRRKVIIFTLMFLLVVTVVVLIAHLFTQHISAIFHDYKKIQNAQHRKLEHINKILHKQAITDNLTGLFNRKHFNKQLGREISRAKRYGISLSIIIFDIDRFKHINDTLGHIHGDKVLKELSALISHRLRHSDVLARWGGEEFALLLPELGMDKALNTAEKLRNLVASHTFLVDQPITCSFGVTELAAEDTAATLINRADQAMYDAKRAGRDTIRSR